MSKASNQTLVLLAMVNGTVMVMEDRNLLTEDTAATALYAKELCEQLIYRYPATGDEKKNLEWMLGHMKTWGKMIDEESKQWSALVLTQMALNILSDLSDKIKNIDVLFDIKDIRDCFNEMALRFIDQEKDEFVPLEEADLLLNTMYRLIGFER